MHPILFSSGFTNKKMTPEDRARKALVVCASFFDDSSKLALRASYSLAHHPRFLPSTHMKTLFRARVCYGIPLSFGDAALMKSMTFDMVHEVVSTLDTALWKISTADMTELFAVDVHVVLNTLTALLGITNFFKGAGSYGATQHTPSTFEIRLVFLGVNLFCSDNPETYVAFVVFVSLLRASSECVTTKLTPACIDALEWAVAHVPEHWISALNSKLWKTLVYVRSLKRSTVCHILEILPKSAWTVFMKETSHCEYTVLCEGICLFGGTRASQRDVTVLAEFIRHQFSDNHAGLVNFLVAMKYNSLQYNRWELLVETLVYLYPEYPTLIFETVVHNYSPMLSFQFVETFFTKLRQTHLQTPRKWTTLWKSLLQINCCMIVLDAMNKIFPPDIWEDDAHLCRFALSLHRCAPLVVKRLFGPRTLTLLDLAKHSAHRDFIKPLMQLAKAANVGPFLNPAELPKMVEHRPLS